MADFLTLSCPSCGGKLQITSEIERFACGYCGTEQIVKRSGGIVSLSPLIDGLNKINVGVDRTASELAIARLNREIPEIELNIRESLAWFSERISNTKHIKSGMYIDVLIKLLEYEVEQKKGKLKSQPSGIKELNEFENRLNILKSLVNELREKQSQLKKHKEIVSQ